MPALRFSYGLLALCFTASCFSPDYHCRIICKPSNGGSDCPSGFDCQDDPDKPATGLCRSTAPSMPLCQFGEVGVEVDAGDAGVPGGDGGLPPLDAAGELDGPLRDAPSVDAPHPSDARPDASPPPEELCYRNECFKLSAESRRALVIWLDPSNLPAAGTPVERWRDRSGAGNDALPFSPSTVPTSRGGDGVQLELRNGGGMQIVDNPTLDVGNQDFTIAVVAGWVKSPPNCAFRKRLPGPRADIGGIDLRTDHFLDLGVTRFVANVNGVYLDSGEPAAQVIQTRLLVLRRQSDEVQLRLDGKLAASGRLQPPAQSASAPDNVVLLGTCGAMAQPLPVLNAVVMLRGPLAANDVGALEGFLMRSFPGGR